MEIIDEKREDDDAALSNAAQAYVQANRKPEPIVKVGILPERKAPKENWGESFEPGRVMAIVGGEPILAADLIFEARQIIEKAAPQAPEEVKDRESKKLLPRLLPKYIDAKILYVDIVQGLPDGADIDKIFESLGSHFDEKVLDKIMEASGVKTEAEFDAKLRGQQSSLRQFRMRWIKDEFVKYFLSQKIQQRHEVTHQEMLGYYREHKEEFAFQAKAKWEQLVVLFSRTPDRGEARRQIAEMGNEVVYGAAFGAVAKRKSHGFNAPQGGQQGWVNAGSLALKELDEAIFRIPVGELSDLIETDQGFHIIRVQERAAAGHTSFSEAQVEIRKKLLEKKRQADFAEHLEKVRKRIPVEVLETTESVAQRTNSEIQ